MEGTWTKTGFENPAYVYSINDLNKTNVNGDTGKKSDAESEEIQERSQWGNGIEFLMSCIAMSVGLGNIWRFPFVAKANGGGAFLIPYLIVLTLIGRPIYYMEMTLGQFSSRGCANMYQKMSPVFRGIGIGQVIGATGVATYYCSILAVTLFYFFNSFTNNFPWSICQDSWKEYQNLKNITCAGKNGENGTTSSSELYFRLEVLKAKDDISDGIDLPEWRLTLFLLLSWVVAFFVSAKGVKSSGKASYFLAIFPYVIMITLLIRSATLEGAVDGMKYFIETDFSKLLEAKVWYAAVTQCFFSLNVGFGTITTFSSFNKFSHNINRDAFIVTTLDTFTSLLSGITIFGILGHLAFKIGTVPENVVSGGGTELAFISYPEALSKFENVPWLFAIAFFLMLFVLGIGSLAALHANLNTLIKDSFPTIPNWIITGITSCALFLIGLLYVTPGGQLTLDLVDHFAGTFVIFVCVILEVVAVNWVYGLDNLCMDVEFMTKKKVHYYWRFCWGLVIPIMLTVIFLYFIATLEPMKYTVYGTNTVNLYPTGLNLLGWGILVVTVAQILMWLCYYLYVNRKYPVKEMISRTFSTETWGPSGVKRTEEWSKFKENKISQRGPPTGPWIIQKLKLLVKT